MRPTLPPTGPCCGGRQVGRQAARTFPPSIYCTRYISESLYNSFCTYLKSEQFQYFTDRSHTPIFFFRKTKRKTQQCTVWYASFALGTYVTVVRVPPTSTVILSHRHIFATNSSSSKATIELAALMPLVRCINHITTYTNTTRPFLSLSTQNHQTKRRQKQHLPLPLHQLGFHIKIHTSYIYPRWIPPPPNPPPRQKQR